MGYQYSTAQICLNGHKISSNVSNGDGSRFCASCGAETITACPHCTSPIRGSANYDGYYMSMAGVPAFCHQCGKAYEWTLRQVQAAKDLADEVEDIDPDELAKAKESFIALASDTPQTPVAAARISKLLKKAGPVVGGGIRDIVVSIGTEAAKKMLGF